MAKHTALDRTHLRAVLAAFPRIALSQVPTPLEKMENLSRHLGANIYVKREDMTGLAFGGNKARKLDFIMADAMGRGATSVVTWAGVQSNWCRQVAAAARKQSIQPVLVLFKRKGLPSEVDGNLLIDQLLGAEIHMLDLKQDQKMMEIESVRPILDSIVEKERKRGRRPYIAPIGGSMTEGSMDKPLGALAYVDAMVEILDQAETLGVAIDYVVVASGSGSTHAGLVAGAKLCSPALKIVGISVGDNCETITKWVTAIGSQTLHALGQDREIAASEVIVHDRYFGEGYALLNPETTHSIRKVAEIEGLLLDPVYTGKAMTGLFDLFRKNYFRRGANIVFIHTGGTPALFPYRQRLQYEFASTLSE